MSKSNQIEKNLGTKFRTIIRACSREKSLSFLTVMVLGVVFGVELSGCRFEKSVIINSSFLILNFLKSYFLNLFGGLLPMVFVVGFTPKPTTPKNINPGNPNLHNNGQIYLGFCSIFILISPVFTGIQRHSKISCTRCGAR